MTGIKR